MAIYIVELWLKLYALRWAYFKVGWNIMGKKNYQEDTIHNMKKFHIIVILSRCDFELLYFFIDFNKPTTTTKRER